MLVVVLKAILIGLTLLDSATAFVSKPAHLSYHPTSLTLRRQYPKQWSARKLASSASALKESSQDDTAIDQATMSTPQELTADAIRVAMLEDTPNDDELSSLVALINAVYDVAEDGMWKSKGMRTNRDEIVSLIQEKRLLVAIAASTATNDGADQKDQIVGCVKVERLTGAGEFGMLVVDPNCRSQGIGGKLVAAAEKWAIDQKFGDMQLELLTPRTWQHPSKEFNKKWYTRLGYIPLKTEPFEKDYGHLSEYLATECDFTIWRKKLISS